MPMTRHRSILSVNRKEMVQHRLQQLKAFFDSRAAQPASGLFTGSTHGHSTTLNAWVAYNYRSQKKWGKGSLNIGGCFNIYGGLTTTNWTPIYTTYNSFPSVSYDDLNPTGSSLLPAIFNTSQDTNTDRCFGIFQLTSNDFGRWNNPCFLV